MLANWLFHFNDQNSVNKKRVKSTNFDILDKLLVKVRPNGKVMDSRIRAASPNDEIVISGISGKFPSAKNVAEFAEKLYNKVGSSMDTNEMSRSRNRWLNI